MADFLRDFDDAVGEYTGGLVERPIGTAGDARRGAGRMPKPMEHERFNFRLTQEEWEDFLRRLGFGEDEGEQKDGDTE